MSTGLELLRHSDVTDVLQLHCMCVLVTQLCSVTLCDPVDCSPPGKNTGVGSHSLLQGIFPTQGLNPGFLHCRQILYHLSHQGSPSASLGINKY